MYCPNPKCLDATETGVPAEYRDGIAECPSCNSALVASPPDWTIVGDSTTADSADLVTCVTVGNASLLPYIKSILDGAGVPYLVKNEGVQHWIGWGTAVLGFNPITGPPVVMVEASRMDEATALLAEISQVSEDREDASGDTAPETRATHSVCGHCGGSLDTEVEDATLSHCYHCGWPVQSA